MPAFRLIVALFCATAAASCSSIVGKFSGRTEACAILAIGTPAPARIVRLIDTGTTINDDPVVDFVLEVMPEDAPNFEATARALVSRLDVASVQPGTLVRVKYDPAMPERVAIDAWECDDSEP